MLKTGREMTGNLSIWKKEISDSYEVFDVETIEYLETSTTEIGLEFGSGIFFYREHVYNIFRRVCLSKARLASHMRFRDSKQSQTAFMNVLRQKPTDNLCYFCEKICESTACLFENERS